MRLVVAACLALALPRAALAHDSGPVIPDAVEALKQGQIYVDYDARPTLTELEADALGRRLAQKPAVYVAVLPASVTEEAGAAPEGIAHTIADEVGRPGLYVVSVGGKVVTSGDSTLSQATWLRPRSPRAARTGARGRARAHQPRARARGT